MVCPLPHPSHLQVDAVLGVSAARQQQLDEEEMRDSMAAEEALRWAGPTGSQMERLRSQAAIEVATSAAAETAELSERSQARDRRDRDSAGSEQSQSMGSTSGEPRTPGPATDRVATSSSRI